MPPQGVPAAADGKHRRDRPDGSSLRSGGAVEAAALAAADPLAGLEAALDHTFADRTLLQEALTHRSYRHEHPDDLVPPNERLEFLGDAILHFVAADELFAAYVDAPEGELTTMRAALVRTESLAAIAEELHLADYVRVSRGESTIDGRGRQSILAGTLEALIAAVYRDGGLSRAHAVVRRLLRPYLATARAAAAGNAKGQLQEAIQAAEGITPFYRVVERSGPVHATQFVVEVVAGDRVLGRGQGVGKRQAEQRAAEQALEALQAASPGAAE
jgi:ribonuclease-3